MEYLEKAAEEFRVQVVFTTHSSIVLQTVYNLLRKERKQEDIAAVPRTYNNKIIYLEPEYIDGDRYITAENIIKAAELNRCINDMSLKPTVPDAKLRIYCEDSVAANIADYLLEKMELTQTPILHLLM